MRTIDIEVVSTYGHQCKVRATGQIVAETNDAFLAAIYDLIDQGFEKIEIDLSGVTYISSTGISVFLELIAISDKQALAISFVSCSRKVRDILHLAGVLSLTSGIEEA